MNMYQAISICFVLVTYILGAHMPADKVTDMIFFNLITRSLVIFHFGFTTDTVISLSQHFCGFLAFSMYYFVLATFFWLLLSIIRIHGRFTSMFSSQVKIEMVHFIIGWGRSPCRVRKLEVPSENAYRHHLDLFLSLSRYSIAPSRHRRRN